MTRIKYHDATEVRQRIFDTAVAGLAQQAFIRSRHDLSCAYTGFAPESPNAEVHCAIGWVIKDVYRSAMEYNTVATLAANYPETRESLGFKSTDLITWDGSEVIDFQTEEAKFTMRFLEDLQLAHDNGAYPQLMKHNLFNVGYEWGLVIPEILQDVEVE